MELEIERTPHGIRVCGEMTVYSAATLKPALLAAAGAERKVFELDLSQVTEFDTAGLQLLLMLQRAVSSAACELQISGCSRVVRSALELCRQDQLIGPPAAREVSP